MKKLISGLSLGIVTLLWAAAGMAAEIAVVPSSTTVAPGDVFTVAVNATNFPGDGSTTGVTGGSFTFTFDGSVLAITGASLPLGSPNTPGNPFDFITPLTLIDTDGVGTDSVALSVLRNGTAGFNYASGDFAAFTLQFQVRNTATPGAAANIVMFDDGIDNSWTLQDANPVLGVVYTQAGVSVALPNSPNIDVTDSVAPADDHTVPFGNVDLALDVTQTVTVTNSGTVDLNVGAIVQPADPQFSVVNNDCGVAVPPAGTCTFTVHFIPTANGAASSSFDIPSDDPDTATVTVTLSGVGGLPDIVVTDNDTVGPADPVQFGDVQTNAPSDLLVTITNNGPGDLHLGTITAPADTHFTLPGNLCSGQTLTNMATCVVTVRFAPTANGVLNSSFTIPSDDADTPIATVNLNGNGVIPPTADIAVSENSPIDFGNVQVNQSGAPLTVTVTNNGAVDLVIGPLAGVVAPFILSSDTCSNNAGIPTSGTCTFDLTFAPTVAGAATATLAIPSNDPDTPTVSLVLNGNGTPAPVADIAVSTTTIPFGDIPAGTTATPVTVTVTNTGGADLVLGQIAVANPLPAPYGIANNTCSTDNTLEPIGSGTNTCTFDVTFAPTASGTVNEAFDIPSNDPDVSESPVIVNVSGTGTVPDINVSDSDSAPLNLTLSFGNVSVDDTSSPITVTVSNAGLAPLDIGVIDDTNLPATVTIGSDTCSSQIIAPAGSCTLEVTFAPTAIGTLTGSFDIPSNDPDENPVTVTVNGKGVGPNTGLTGGSALDPATLLGLGLLGFAMKRRRRR